jgi:hypothetical protein
VENPNLVSYGDDPHAYRRLALARAAILGIVVILGLYLCAIALGQEPVTTTTVTSAATATTIPVAVPSPTPTPVLAPMNDPSQPSSVRWLDRTLMPLVNYLGEHPILLVIGGALALLAIWFGVANCIVWALRVKYDNDRKKAPTKILILWNILETFGGAPWIMLGRTARHYWPLPFRPWEDTGEGHLDGSQPRPLPDPHAGEPKP